MGYLYLENTYNIVYNYNYRVIILVNSGRMKMSKRPKVSIAEMRAWLYQYELGEPIELIAKSARRDVRTVSKYIVQARKEADLRVARKEMLTRALTKHNDELLAVVKNIIDALQVPNSQLDMRQDEDGEWVDIPLQAAKAYAGQEGTKIELQDENTKRWKFIFEHLSNESLLLKLSNWKNMMATHIDLRKSLKTRFLDLVQAKTRLTTQKEAHDTPVNPVLYLAIGDVLLPIILNRAFGVPDKTDPEHNLKINDQGYVSLLGTGTKLGWLSSERSDLLDGITKALEDLGQSREYEELRANYSNLQRVTHELREEFEEFTLLGYIAGRCSLCEKLER
jgi:hypothetical protein